MINGADVVDKILRNLFYKLGYVVAKKPGYFLIIPVLLTFICATGFQRLHYEMDSEYLFSPEDGRAKTERAVIESFFKMNYSSAFNPSRITRQGRYGRIIVIPKFGANMLTENIWNEVCRLDILIKEIAVVYGEDKKSFRFPDICARWNKECYENDVLNLKYMMKDIENKHINLTFPIMFNPVTWDIHVFPAYFGKPVLDNDSNVLSVPSIQLVYFLDVDSKVNEEIGSLWEDAFLNEIGKAEENGTFQLITIARFASKTLDEELEKNTRSVAPYFGTTFIIMIIFSITTCMMSDWVRSKPMLGLLGNISAIMGTLAAFGFAVYCGLDFIGIILVAPFLTCSIGIDDTFVMLAAWRRTPVTMDVPERMANMMSEAAVSVTITSLTDVVSLWIGKNSPFPAIQLFCIYTGLAVTFIFVWHVTFFAACIALYGYLEQKNLHSITCMPVLPVSLSHKKSCIYRLFCTGGINLNDTDNTEDTSENGLMVWFRDVLGNLLCKWPFKVLIFLAFIGYFAGAIYGITRIQEGLQRRKLSRPDSYSIDFYDREDFYFREYPYRIQVLIAGELEYWNETVQNKIENLLEKFESNEFIAQGLYTESWLHSFLEYVDRNEEQLNLKISSKELFISTLKEFWLYRPNAFSLDVKFDESENNIVATRFILQAVNTTDSNKEREMLNSLRKIADESTINVTVYHPYFVFFDQFELVRPTSMQSLFIGGLTMMGMSFIFIPDILCSFWVALSVVSIEMGVIGYMSLWNVNLDSISMVNLIMCVGFSVDFSAHICYAFMSSKADSSNARVKESLFSLGLPVLQGALSTILGVSALLFVGSYIFSVFFKVIVLVTIFGALHGLLLLPVLLSMFNSTGKKNEPPKMNMQKAYCISYPHPMESQFHGAKHFGIPLHGMVRSTNMHDMNRKRYAGQEKNLGHGTSEDSSESCIYEQQFLQKKLVMPQKCMQDWNTQYPNPHSRKSNHHSNINDNWRKNVSMECLQRTKIGPQNNHGVSKRY